MQSCNQVSILGNDKRMDYVAQYLFDKGFEINKELSKIDESNIVIVEPNSQLDFEKLIICMHSDSKLYISKTNILLEKQCIKRNIKLYEYLNNKEIVYENSKLTALGILREAKKYGAIIEHSNCFVCGFGFCGKAITKELILNKANVDVFVRRKELKASIEEMGAAMKNMNELASISFEKYSYIFNTAPALIFTSNLLERFSNNIVIFDVASMPGGVDFNYCNKNNIEVHHCLGIPGRLYPKEAGLLIAKVIFNSIYKLDTSISD